MSPGVGIAPAIAGAEGSDEDACCVIGDAASAGADVGLVAVVGPVGVSGGTAGVDEVGASTLPSTGSVAEADEAATELTGSGDPAAAAVGVAVPATTVASWAWWASLWSGTVRRVGPSPSSSELVPDDLSWRPRRG
jgi:hypothetical protein